MPELTTQENKIIKDILFHLDGWRVNDHPKETRKIESFLDPDEVGFDNEVRKEVSSKEVLHVYDMAKIHALNYIRRKEFPNNPAVYQAICYWAAGLLSEKASFRDDRIKNDYNLIEEARKLLSPYVKRNDEFFLVRGDDFFWEEYMQSERHPHPRRDRIPWEPDEDGDEEKERLIHGHFHEHHKEHFHHKPHRKPKHHCPRRKDPFVENAKNWINNIKTNKFDIDVRMDVDEEFGSVKFNIYLKRFGKPCDRGKVMLYVYEDE